MQKDLLTVDEAAQLVLNKLFSPERECVPLGQSVGRITSSDWLADQDYPPFDRVMMDGVALSYAAWQSGIKSFRNAGIQRAGAPALLLIKASDCIEIMTGAVIPHGTDTVVPYEMIQQDGGLVIIDTEIKQGQHVHKAGTDVRKGDTIVPANTRIGLAETGIAASIGMTTPEVWKFPVVEIISTGDELVDISMKPESFQIRRSNDLMLEAMLATEGIRANRRHVADNEADIRSVLTQSMMSADVLLITGGVSKGKFDLLPDILEDCGIEAVFHRVSQKPGKPFWFGIGQNTFVFAFPGNPVSACVCAVRYFMPWLRASLQKHGQIFKVALKDDFTSHPRLTLFTQVKLSQSENGVFIAEAIRGKGSGDFAQLTRADGFVEIPPAESVAVAQSLVNFYPYPGTLLS